MISSGGGPRITDELVERALAPFADKSCDGVRMQLLAEEVMLT